MNSATLAAELEHSGRLQPERAVAVLIRIATALEAAQAQHAPRRDVIHPANIVLTSDGADLIDTGGPGADDAASGTSIEALAYLAPERLTYNVPVSPATDVYALSCVLYACLTGGPPYPAIHDLAALVSAHQTAPIPRPSRSAPIPAGLDEVVVRGLSKDPTARYDSVSQLVASAQQALGTPLVGACSGEQLSPLWAASEAPVMRVSPPITAHNRRLPRPRRWIVVATAAAVVVALVAVGTLIVHRVMYNSPTITAHTPRTVAATITIDEGPRDVVVDPNTRIAYTTNYSGNPATGSDGFATLSIIDTATNALTNTINVPTGHFGGLKGLAIDTVTGTVYIADSARDSVLVFDTRSNTVTTTIGLGRADPTHLAVNPDAHSLYTANFAHGSVSIIDTNNNTVTTTIEVGGKPTQVALDPDARTAYVANSSNVTIIDTTTNSVTATIDTGNQPIAVAVDVASHTAYVANLGGSVTVIDTTTNTVTTTIDTGNLPNGIALDPDTHTAYVANLGGSVTVIDTTTNTVTTTIDGTGAQDILSIGINGIAVDTHTHVAYVTNTHENTVTVIAPSVARH